MCGYNMNKCLILMATYNGEKYLKKQIDSIINQSFTTWKLIIRDDGSNDKTVEILEEYSRLDDRISIIRNLTDNHGAFLNFWTLIRSVYSGEKFDYYFFCDQDDIWVKDKIQKMINFAEIHENNVPTLIYSDMQIIDDEDNVKIESLNRVMGIGSISGYTEFYTGGYFWGCSIMLNSSLFNYIDPLDVNIDEINIMSHDNYYAKLCMLVGNVYFIDETLIKHREHDSNHTKGYSYKLSPRKILNKFFAIGELAKTHAKGFIQTLITLKHFREHNIDLSVMKEIETAIKSGGVKGVRILKRHKVKRKQKSRTIGFYLIVYLKLYKKYINRYI